MVVHVGASLKYGLFAAYDTDTKEIKKFIVTRSPEQNESKIENFFLCIKENIFGSLGCFCIMFDGYVKNETRMEYIKAAKKYGFQKAEIISVGRAELIDAIKNISFSNEDNQYHDQMHTNYDNTQTIKIDDLKSIMKKVEEKFTISKLAIFDFEYCLTKDAIEAVFPNPENIYLCQQKPWINSTLLYACYLSGASEFSKYEVNEALEKRITIKLNDEIVMTVEKFTPLPFSTNKLISIRDFQPFKTATFHVYDFDELVEGYIIEKPPNHFKIILEIDSNTISYFKAIFNNADALTINEQNVNELYFRIPGRAFYFGADLMGVGIDFGTSKCCNAVNRKNRIELVVLENTGSRMLQTYVTFDEKNEKFGEIAINRMRENSMFTVFDIKRILGNKFEDIQIDKMWPFKLKKLENQVFVEVETFEGRKLLKPEEIASTFFKHIKIKVDEFQNKNLIEAVITIPASYNETQKQSIIEAAKLGGWKIIYLLPEPIAAAFAYCDAAALEINLNLLIFDLGGGTLDIFIVKTAKCMLNFLASNGSLFLGGRDFDTILVKYFEKNLHQKYGIEIMKNESKKYKFMADCQEAKNTLSYEMEASIDIENYDTNIEGFISITRNKFEQLSFSLLQEIENITQEAVNKANKKNDEIDVVLYVGGGCKMPMIKELLLKMFPKSRHYCKATPDEMVAEGACLYGCLLKCKYP